MPADKLPLILWSGGLDSTHLVWNQISNGRSVDVAYVLLRNNEAKVARETKARNKIKKYLGAYDASIRNDYTVDIPTIHPSDDVHMVQALAWVYAAQLLYNPDKHTHIEMGYIRGDDFWHIRHDVDMANEYLSKAFHMKGIVKYVYPLEWKDKASVLKAYDNKFGKKLLKKITYCEGYDDAAETKKCKCKPCKTMRAAKHDG